MSLWVSLIFHFSDVSLHVFLKCLYFDCVGEILSVSLMLVSLCLFSLMFSWDVSLACVSCDSGAGIKNEAGGEEGSRREAGRHQRETSYATYIACNEERNGSSKECICIPPASTARPDAQVVELELTCLVS